jgi:hypothetical protein
MTDDGLKITRRDDINATIVEILRHASQQGYLVSQVCID